MSKGLVKDTLAGGFGGMCLVLVGHPLDTIKVRIQTMVTVPGQPPPYRGMIDCASKIIKADGLLGLYRGMLAPLTGVTPMYSLCFFGYNVGKQIFCTENSFKDLELVRIGLAGATSGIFTTPILAPLERLKCILQVQNATAKPGDQKFKGPWDLGKHLIKTGGITSLNRGYLATNLRDSLASIAYFTTYEVLKRKLRKEGDTSLSVWRTILAGGLAGMANWVPAIPVDTLKSRLQVAPDGKYNGIRSVAAEIFKEHGVTGGIRILYRGTGPVMVRAFPANAACFLGYETSLKVLNNIWP